MAECGVAVDHSTLNRWVIHYAPLMEDKFRKNHKRQVGRSWRMDETYIKVKGVWDYLYRAVDKDGDTIDFMLSEKRDKPAAKAFFVKAIGSGLPEKVNIDKSGANKAGMDVINIQLMIMFLLGLTVMQITIRQIKYLNNIVEQDHRVIKRITNSMLGFKAFYSAEAILVGIELHRMLKKGQHMQAANTPVYEQFYALAAYSYA
jgi:putative transposase